MASQCRSSKCTAERKGVRRELDSWRHKLIRCVGFESILEGIYGQRLLRDLSIFADCEPEVVSDWSVEASCSFCNLQLDKISDHIPTVSSPQSSPTEDLPAQGESYTEKIKYQADKFLHAVFRKKDPPQSCDQNIPLVAQELMKKMIRQFAIEYASKNQFDVGQNGSSMCMGADDDWLQRSSDQDGPLDLTVTRPHPVAEQDGALDLSRKGSSSSTESICTSQKDSGSLVPTNVAQADMDKQAESIQLKTSPLEMALSSFCHHHKMLLFHILKFIHEDYIASVAQCDDAHRPLHLRESCHQDASLTYSQESDCCCEKTCRPNVNSMTPMCFCLQNFCLSCKSMAINCISKVIVNRMCNCYHHPKQCPCVHPNFRDGDYISLDVHSARATPSSRPKNVCESYSSCIRGHSPSPPPLALMSYNVGKLDDTKPVFPCVDEKRWSIQAPSLLHHEEKDAVLHRDKLKEVGFEEIEGTRANRDCAYSCTQTGQHFDQNGTIFQDLRECINERLKAKEPWEKEQNVKLPINQNKACSNDTQLGKILTVLLHTESDEEYSNEEFLQQSESKVERDIQTHSQKECEMFTIKTEHSESDSFVSRKQLTFETLGNEHIKVPSTNGSNLVGFLTGSEKNILTDGGMMESGDDQKHSFQCNMTNKDILKEVIKTDTYKQSLTSQYSCDLYRSRRNIVPPKRFSAYVTEPRKMYFAACFSESIFHKRCSREKFPKNDDSLLNQSFTEQIAKDTCKTRSYTERPNEDVPLCNEEAADSPSKTRKQEHSKQYETNYSHNKATEQNESNPDSDARLVPASDKIIYNSVLQNLNPDQAECTETSSEESQSVSKYTSPIRLMYLSQVVSEEGVRYSLKSSSSDSNNQRETFDPCVESSWGGIEVVEEDQPFIKNLENRGDDKRSDSNNSVSSCPSKECDIQKEVWTVNEVPSLTPPKRKPGRPKKLGPRMEKTVKRPIGRPPKHKCGNFKSTPCKAKTSRLYDEDERSKSLKITVVYGRSRRVKRLVSEGSPKVKPNQVGSVIGLNTNTNPDKLLEEEVKNFSLIANKKSHASKNMQYPQQKCFAAIRKPGRPPKIKISGISVTVTTVSPKQRKIHMNRDVTKMPEISQNIKPFVSDNETPKEQKTIDLKLNAGDNRKSAHNEANQKIPLRHSVRIRKPSIHLLHSVATSRALSHSNALLRRSRKLLMSKASGECNHLKNFDRSVKTLVPAENPSRIPCGSELSIISGISVDSIFHASEPFKWWPTSASTEKLNQEFTERIKLMSATWVREKESLVDSIPSKDEALTKSNSPVKMLFQKHFSMENLCAWFMQTTETQSLAIVKKASTRNDYEIVQYNPSRATSKVRLCSSLQTERLRKHVKKFATIVPKSPAVFQEQRMSKIHQRHVKRRLIFQQSSDLCSRHETLKNYRATLLRVRTKFMIRKRMSHSSSKFLHSPSFGFPCNKAANSHLEPFDKSSTETRHSASPIENGEGSNVSHKEQIRSKTWSPETLRECRVFLKKINSPEAKSVVEECNFCTIELCDVSPSGHSLHLEKECAEKATSNAVKLPRKLLSHRMDEQFLPRKWKSKRKANGTSDSMPAKITRRSLTGCQFRQ